MPHSCQIGKYGCLLAKHELSYSIKIEFWRVVMQNNTQDLTINKLIILFLLKNINTPITQTQITDFVLYKEYTDYFSLQQYLSELAEAKLIDSYKDHNDTTYIINKRGIHILDMFINRIPFSVKNDILEFTKEDSLKVNLFCRIFADIIDDENNYVVDCSIKEKENPILELKIKTASKDEAKLIRMNWLKNARSIYKTIISDLTEE